MANNYEVFKTDIDISLKNIKASIDQLKQLDKQLRGVGNRDVLKPLGQISATLEKNFGVAGQKASTSFFNQFKTGTTKTLTELDKVEAATTSIFRNLPKKAQPHIMLLRKEFTNLLADARKYERDIATFSEAQTFEKQLAKKLASKKGQQLPQSVKDELEAEIERQQAIQKEVEKQYGSVKHLKGLYSTVLRDLENVHSQVTSINEEQVNIANGQRKQKDELKETIAEQQKLLKMKEQEAQQTLKSAAAQERFADVEARRAALRSTGALGAIRGAGGTLAGVKEVIGREPIQGIGDAVGRVKEVLAVTQDFRKNINDVIRGINIMGAEGGNVFLGLRRAIYGDTESTSQFGKVLQFAIDQTVSLRKEGDALKRQAGEQAEQMVRLTAQLRTQGDEFKKMAQAEGAAANEFNRLLGQISKAETEFTKLQTTIQSGGKPVSQTLRAQIDSVTRLSQAFEAAEQRGILKKGGPAWQALQQMKTSVTENAHALQEIDAQLKAVDKGGSVWDKMKRAVSNMTAPFRSVKKEIDANKESAFALTGSFGEAEKKAGLIKGSIEGMTKAASTFKDVFLGAFAGTALANVLPQLISILTTPIRIPVDALLSPFRLLSNIISTVTGQIQSFFASLPDQFMQANRLVQDFNTTMRQMLTGFEPEKIEKAIQGANEFIRKIIAKTPFELATGQQAFQQLVTAGFDPKKWLEPAADAAAAFNKDMHQLIFAMQRLKSGSKGMGVDMLRDFGIPVQQVGVWIDEASGKMVESNKVLGKSKEELQAAGYAWKQWKFDAAGSLEQTPIEALDILNGYLQQNAIFAGASAARAKTLSGVLSNLKDSVTTILTAFGQPVFQTFTDILTDIYEVVQQVTSAVEPFAILIGQELSASIKSMWESITGIKRGAGDVADQVEAATSRIKEIASSIIQFLKPALMVILALVQGDFGKAWGLFLKYASDAVKKVAEFLKTTGKDAFKWGVNLVKQIAQGLIYAAKTVIRGAVSLIGNVISDFLKPGSPPKTGPLKTIDKWGKGLIETFSKSFKFADMDFLTQMTEQIKGVFDNMGLDKYKGIRQTLMGIIGGINQTGMINEELWSKVQSQLGKGNRELKEYLRATLELKKVSKEYADAEAAGFVSQELQDRLDAARLQVALKEEELKLQEQINQANQGGGASGTGTKPADIKKNLEKELELLKKRRDIGLITEKEYLDGVAQLRRQAADDFLKAGKTGEAKKQVDQAREVDKKIFESDKEFLEKKRKLGIITEAEYLDQLRSMNLDEAEKLLAAGDEAAAREKINQAKQLEKQLAQIEKEEQLKALNEEIEREREILRIKYEKGLIDEKEYREGLVKLQEGYIDQLLQMGYPVDKEIDKLKELKEELKKLTDVEVDQPQDILAGFGEEVTGELQSLMDSIKSEFASLGTSTWEEFSGIFKESFGDIWNDLKSQFFGEEGGSGGLGDIKALILDWASGLWADLTAEDGPLADMTSFFDRITEGFTTWSQSEDAQQKLNEAGRVIGGVLKEGVLSAIGLGTGETEGGDVIAQFARGIGQMILGLRDLITSTMSELFQGVFEGLGMDANLANSFGLAISAILTLNIGYLAQKGGETGQAIINGIITAFAPLPSFVKAVFVDPIISAFNWVYDTLVGHSIVPDLADRIVEIISGIPERLMAFDFAGQIVGMFDGIYDQMVEAGQNIVQGLIDGINQTKESMELKVSEVAGTIRSYWPFSPAEKGPLSQMPNWTDYLVVGLQQAISVINPTLGGVVNLVKSVATTASATWTQMNESVRQTSDQLVQTVNSANDRISQSTMRMATAVSEAQTAASESMTRLSQSLGSGFGNYGHGESGGPSIGEQGGIAASWIRFFNLLRQRGSITTYGQANHQSGYASGTMNVPYTGTAMIHKGEMILPAQMAESVRQVLSQTPHVTEQTNRSLQQVFQAGAFTNAFPNVTNARDAKGVMGEIQRSVARSQVKAKVI